jgi:multicomponent K+:H+ antiporter subunit G
MLLSRAALYRDRAESNPDVPALNPPEGVLDQPKATNEAESVNPDRDESEQK